jgi:peptide chain release factor 2
LGQERAQLEQVVEGLDKISTGLADAGELLDMAVEEDDGDTVNEVVNDLAQFEKTVGGLEFRRMFSGEMDPNNAYVDIQSGAGGTEAQDWCEMLLRMYLRCGCASTGAKIAIRLGQPQAYVIWLGLRVARGR